MIQDISLIHMDTHVTPTKLSTVILPTKLLFCKNNQLLIMENVFSHLNSSLRLSFIFAPEMHWNSGQVEQLCPWSNIFDLMIKYFWPEFHVNLSVLIASQLNVWPYVDPGSQLIILISKTVYIHVSVLMEQWTF